jgi:hypothetical protein
MQTSMPSPVTSNTAIKVERRRPGRIASPDVELIPLMRKPRPPQEVLEEAAEKWEPREPALPPRGIALGVVLCVPIWLAIGAVFYQLLK